MNFNSEFFFIENKLNKKVIKTFKFIKNIKLDIYLLLTLKF